MLPKLSKEYVTRILESKHTFKHRFIQVTDKLECVYISQMMGTTVFVLSVCTSLMLSMKETLNTKLDSLTVCKSYSFAPC